MAEAIFSAALAHLVEDLQAERIVILHADPPEPEPPVQACHGVEGAQVWTASDVSLSVIRNCLRDGLPILTNTAHELPEREFSSLLADVKSIVCAPLWLDSDRIGGVIYADGKQGTPHFSRADLSLVQTTCRAVEQSLKAGQPQGLLATTPDYHILPPARPPAAPRAQLASRLPPSTTSSTQTDWRERARCRPETIAIFCRQLALLFRSGVGIVPSLDALSHQEDANFGEAVLDLATQVEQGITLSHAMSRFPLLFDRVFLAMVRVGEDTGGLSPALDRTADWLERAGQTRRRVVSSLMYPAFVLLSAALITLGLFVTVMPGLFEVFEGRNLELPLITRAVLWLTAAAQNPGVHLAVLGLVGLAVAGLRDYGRTEEGRIRLYSLALRIPLVGPILHLTGLSRYCSAIAMLNGAGLNLLQVMPLAAQASANPMIEEDAATLIEDLTQGEPLSAHLAERPDCYPSILVGLVRVGEESGHLGQMVGHFERLLEQELEGRLEALTAALEPLLVTLVAGAVATVVLSIFLPLYGMLASFV